jgi:hypothetical protein
MEKTCSTTLLRLLLTPSNTSNQRLKYHATKSEDGCTHFTRLAVAALLLPLPNLTTVWNHNSIDSATFKLSAMPLDLSGFIFRRVAWSRTYHLSLKFSSKFNAPFSFNGKIMPTKNVIELAFLQKKSLIMFYCLLLGKTRSYFVSSNDEKLDDLEVSTKYC